MKRYNELKQKSKITFFMMLIISSVIILSSLLVGGVAIMLVKYDIIPMQVATPVLFVFLVLLISVVVQTIFSAIISKKALKPINNLVNGIQQVAQGNFDVRLGDYGLFMFQNISDNFNTMASELKGIETLRYDFINNFSHEFKTPIVSIRGFAKLLKNPNLSSEDRSEYLDIIINESSRLAEMSNNVLNLSKLENSNIVIDKREFSLDEQIRNCILILEQLWNAKNLEFSIHLDDVNFFGNDELLQQVWLNLINNAIKFTPSKGHIVVSLKEVHDNAIVTITDSGSGMDSDTQQHIFDRFYQGDKSHTIKGNGLGLPIAKRIIDICDGEIIVKSEVGKGSSFTVILPNIETIKTISAE